MCSDTYGPEVASRVCFDFRAINSAKSPAARPISASEGYRLLMKLCLSLSALHLLSILRQLCCLCSFDALLLRQMCLCRAAAGTLVPQLRWQALLHLSNLQELWLQVLVLTCCLFCIAGVCS